MLGQELGQGLGQGLGQKLRLGLGEELSHKLGQRSDVLVQETFQEYARKVIRMISRSVRISRTQSFVFLRERNF